MGRIHLLEDELINKIAAGEVVERPASVIKELVENALDAGATHIKIELEEGGKKLMSVTDNGLGMSADDLPMAIKRHSTSKIAAADDLFAITTMGFRGEALASIASVSRFTIQSVPQGTTEGTRLTVEDGRVQTSGWSSVSGTTVIVRDLFYNIPARKNFLKTNASELAAVQELVEAMILAHPEIGFTLSHQGKVLQNVSAQPQAKTDGQWVGESLLRGRAQAMLGEDLANALLYVRQSSTYGNMEALISPPGVEKGTGSYLYTFVNGRWVKDKVLRYAVLRGYHSHLLKGRFPVAIVFLGVDPSLVDVNVHPAKTELRFQYSQEVQALIATGIKDALRSGTWALPPTDIPPPMMEKSSALMGGAPTAMDFDLAFPSSSGGTYSGMPRSTAATQSERDTRATNASNKPRDMSVTRTTMSFSGAASAVFAGGQDLPSPTYTAETQQPLAGLFPEDSASAAATPETIPWHELTYLGSFARCYLFFEREEQLLVVDQHAFHERILYERLTRDASLLGRQQPLLVPEAVDLPAGELASISGNLSTLQAMGFGLAIIGDQTLEITAVPALMMNRDLQQLMHDIARECEERGGTRDLASLSHDLLATMACHAAVRSGEDLGEAELKHLLREAATVDFYHNCPHGRRVFRWWRKNQIASWFDRT